MPDIWDWFLNNITTVFYAIADNISIILAPIVNAFTSMLDSLFGPIFSGIGSWLANFWSNAANWVMVNIANFTTGVLLELMKKFTNSPMNAGSANFFSFLLAGVQGIMNAMIPFLFGGPENYHRAIGFQSMLGQGIGVVFDVLFSTFGMFNLLLPAIAISIWFPMWLTNEVIHIWLLIRRVFLIS